MNCTRKNNIYFINYCAFGCAFLIFDFEKDINCENLRFFIPLCGGKILVAVGVEAVGSSFRPVESTIYGVGGNSCRSAIVSEPI